jgi:predicted nucleotidyltransferase
VESEPFLQDAAQDHPYPLVFAVLSGAHLYGFPSEDSDFDIRGVHVLPAVEVVGLRTGPETVQSSEDREGRLIDLVTHDVKKFRKLLLKRNGYVLEQLYSPLVIRTSQEHAELKEIARACITRNHVHHYAGFADNEWRLFERSNRKDLKLLLYAIRVLMTGIHLMRTGEVEANLLVLTTEFHLGYVDELVRRKLTQGERATLPDGDQQRFDRDRERLSRELLEAHAASHLPDDPTAFDALNEFVVRMRLTR